MTIHLSFIDNRDVITTTTTLDTSNNIYQMVRIKHLFSFSKKTKSFFQTTFQFDDKGVQTDPRIRHARSVNRFLSYFN